MQNEKKHTTTSNSALNGQLYRFGADGNLRMYSYERLFYSLYGYDGGTTRTYKYSFDLNPNWVNGQLTSVNFNLHNAMFYPNSYLNFNQDGYYTKHYYNGMERIASRLGDNNLSLATHDPELQDRKDWQDSLIRKNIVEITGYEFLEPGEEQTLEDPKPVFELPQVGMTGLQPIGSGDVYYYHPNHLGSTCYVTDGNASVQQGFLYAPFGEITNEHNSSFGNGVIPKYSFNAKELDEETGMYYYEARYYQPPTFTSRDILFEEKPWLTPYHYCSNNPIKYVDPDGKWPFWFDFKNRQSGWGHQAPQRFFGYSRFYDDNMNLLFDIQGVEFKMEGVTLRLWKGDYGKHRELLPNKISSNVGGAGGEIGLYNPNKSLRIGENVFEASMTKSDLDKIGLISTDLKVYNKQTGDLVVSRSEESSFWTTSFSWDKKGKGEELYSVNTFTFKNNKYASKFYIGLKKTLDKAYKYEHNHNESIKIQKKNNQVIIKWGE